MKKGLKLCAILACAFALCLALVGCGDDAEAKKKPFVGTWELTEMDGATTDDIQLLKDWGMAVECTFSNDGAFKMSLFDQGVEGTWEAKSTTEGSIKTNEGSADMTISDGKLSFEDGSGNKMTFSKTSDEVKDLSSSGEGESK